jgi:3-dehydroquinate synthase
VLYQTVSVALAPSYPVYIGRQLLADPEILLSHLSGSQVLIVSQENISRLYLSHLQAVLDNLQVDHVLLPAGENNKTLTQWEKILAALVQGRHERSTTLLALGGGMVGDMTGFAAACYLRGVNYIQIPTTLIAQVDAAVGGKTAVNLPQGKNLVGAFHQPQAVLADIDYLQTLPKREYISGLAEVIKYGLIRGQKFFYWLEEHLDMLLERDPDALLHAITTSVAIKAEIVACDEKETGLRALLNFGHTFGHALETFNGYENLLHGEAVAIGMLHAARLSAQRGLIAMPEFERIRALLRRLGLDSYQYKSPQGAEWIAYMRHDKKIRNDEIQLIMLAAVGRGIVMAGLSDLEIELLV